MFPSLFNGRWTANIRVCNSYAQISHSELYSRKGNVVSYMPCGWVEAATVGKGTWVGAIGKAREDLSFSVRRREASTVHHGRGWGEKVSGARAGKQVPMSCSKGGWGRGNGIQSEDEGPVS